MKITVTLILMLSFLASCTSHDKNITQKKIPPHWVGDIEFDSNQDSPTFMICDSANIIHRRNGLTYPGGKAAIKEQCLEMFKLQPEFESFSGYAVVRFIINCQGETGRFRVKGLDFDFSSKECPVELKEHLLSIVKQLEAWSPKSPENNNSDFSKYLNFKIKTGQIENILH